MTYVDEQDTAHPADADPDHEPLLDDDSARELARQLSIVFAPGAADRDRDRVVPYAQLEDLARSGLLAVTVPADHGGADVSPAAVAEVFRLLAGGDPNVAEILHGHFVNIHLLKVAGNPDQQRKFFAEVLAGALLATAQTDLYVEGRGRLAVTSPPAVPTRITRAGPGTWRLNGAKVRATGALLSTWIPTLARLDDGTHEGGEELVAFVHRAAAGVNVVDDSDDMGQRTAGTGRVEYADVEIVSDDIVRRGKAVSGPHGVGSFAQLLDAAIEVGIAGAVLVEAAEFVRTKARPAHEAHVHHAADDPLLIQRFGELTVDVRAAEAALMVAADALTEAVDQPAEASATEAAVAVATARVLAERAALAVTSTSFEVGGPAAAARALNLDRHWRNARTHTLDDPIRWKYQHLGRYTVTGVSPPRHRPV